jgi:hypothetical protein
VIALGVGVGGGPDLLDGSAGERGFVARQGVGAPSQKKENRYDLEDSLHADDFQREYGTHELRKLKFGGYCRLSFCVFSLVGAVLSLVFYQLQTFS